MREFEYVITDPVGLHARPAGMLVKKAMEFPGVDIRLQKGEKTADAKRLFSVMSLGAKQGDSLRILLEGGEEEQAEKALKEFFSSGL